VGAVTDIRLDSFTSSPQASDEIRLIVNLDEGETEAAATAIESSWDGTDTTSPMGANSYLYQTAVKVYDALGEAHDITVYFDKTATDHVWEYAVTCHPSEDDRTGFAGTAYAGMLARGTITFSESSGNIDLTSGITMQTLDDVTPTWTNAGLNEDGYPQFSPEFINGVSMNVGLNYGTYSDGGAPATWTNDSLTTTQFSKSSTTVFQSATGYGAGDLQGVNVDVDGVITGIYSNGEVIPLNRVALSKVVNPIGLKKVGGNLFSVTRLSGEAPTYHPGTNGCGNIAPNSLEQSNVDIANEFVKMITTQRGFQANGKIITVTDQMLAELINLKR
jgi:flagellar hook protein FlgE